jgi:hypothetical protein
MESSNQIKKLITYETKEETLGDQDTDGKIFFHRNRFIKDNLKFSEVKHSHHRNRPWRPIGFRDVKNLTLSRQ